MFVLFQQLPYSVPTLFFSLFSYTCIVSIIPIYHATALLLKIEQYFLVPLHVLFFKRSRSVYSPHLSL